MQHKVNGQWILYKFLSTLPARGATVGGNVAVVVGNISIHAPREGSDAFIEGGGNNRTYFYPRSPRGERLFTTSIPPKVD